jgi:hypothetical protein
VKTKTPLRGLRDKESLTRGDRYFFMVLRTSRPSTNSIRWESPRMHAKSGPQEEQIGVVFYCNNERLPNLSMSHVHNPDNPGNGMESALLFEVVTLHSVDDPSLAGLGPRGNNHCFSSSSSNDHCRCWSRSPSATHLGPSERTCLRPEAG